MRDLCSRCGMGPVIARMLCRRCYDADGARREARAEWHRSQVRWRKLGLTVDPLAGWTGVHGLAVNPSRGPCVYRRPSRALLGSFEVRRPGHPLAGTAGWVAEPRMWLFDDHAEGLALARRVGLPEPELRCQWCRAPLAWKARPGRLLAHPARLDLNVGWTPFNTAPACWVCSGIQKYGADAIDARLKGRAR